MGTYATRVLLLAAFVALAAARAPASIIIENWNNAPSVAGWTSDESWVTLANPGSGGINDTGYLRISLDATATQENEPGAEWYALARTSASALFAGNWEGQALEFDFFAEDVAPQYVQVRWGSATNSTVWRATVYDSGQTSMTPGNWTRLTAPNLDSYINWNYGGGNQEQFVNDLSTIDWIGVYIWRDSDLGQNYGLDDFRLTVPEPAEYMMLASALLSAAFSIRRRRKAAGLVVPS